MPDNFVVWGRPFRACVGAHRPPIEGGLHVTSAAVWHKTGIVPLEWELVFRRLARAARTPQLPGYVRALLQGERGLKWRLPVQWSARALARLLAGKLAGLGCPLEAPQSWEEFWALHWAEWC